MSKSLSLLLCFMFVEEGMIIYISRGLLSSLTEAKDVMSTIAYYNGRMDNRIIINTYAVIDSTSHLCTEYRLCLSNKNDIVKSMLKR